MRIRLNRLKIPPNAPNGHKYRQKGLSIKKLSKKNSTISPYPVMEIESDHILKMAFAGSYLLKNADEERKV